MTIRSLLTAGKYPAILMLCAMLAACSTTQKSSSGTGVQDAAPISEAGKTEPAPASGSSATPPSPEEAPASAVTQAQPAPGDDEARRLQQQLAEQEAQVNQLREDQVNAQRMADEEAARRRNEEAAAAAPSVTSPQSQESAAATTPGAAASSAAGETSAGQMPAADEPLQRSVYFEFDSSSIPEQYDSMLIGHAAFLRANPDFKTEVQGNCDDRGSREYNLALGARRAEAVKKALELAGADGTRIKAVSFGAEKPVAFGQDEEAYRQNRRADIQY